MMLQATKIELPTQMRCSLSFWPRESPLKFEFVQSKTYFSELLGWGDILIKYI